MKPSPTKPAGGDRLIYTVQQLNRTVRQVLEQDFGPLWIEGEISNLARPASGHWYFSLKDPQAQVRCALFRNRRPADGWVPENGQQVLLWARVSLYEARGEFQLIAESIEPLGSGLLRQQLEQLKARLQAEGLFDPAHKKSLPGLPRRIGVVTSLTGAALRDVLQVLRRRAPFIPVIVYPSLVQGEDAVDQLIAALQTAVRRRECDLLLLVRGGGSLEDLWPFNDERLARAIHACPLPVVSGVGHEIDVTIADLVADLRAPTPSAAAELVSPDRDQLEARISRLTRSLIRAMQTGLHQHGRELQARHQRLQTQHPLRRLQQLEQTCDELGLRLQRAMRVRLTRLGQGLDARRRQLRSASPAARLVLYRSRLKHARSGLKSGIGQALATRRFRLQGLARSLETVSPLATLGRGYALVLRDDGTAVVDAAQVSRGEALRVRLARGELGVRVERSESAPD